MSRATSVYIFTLLLSGIAMWVILRIGSHLTAAANLGGVWDIQPRADSQTAAEDFGSTMTVEQSGRFLNLTFAGGQHLSAKLVGQSVPDATGQPTDVTLDTGSRTIRATLDHQRLWMRVRLSGSTPTEFVAVPHGSPGTGGETAKPAH